MSAINAFVLKYIRALEMIGVVMRHSQEGSGMHIAECLLGAGRFCGNFAGGEFRPLKTFSLLKFADKIFTL